MKRIELLKNALTQCELSFEKHPYAFPLRIVIGQLKYLIDLEEEKTDDLSKLKTIKIGWIAARELDGYPDEELINMLHEVSVEAEKIKVERNFDD